MAPPLPLIIFLILFIPITSLFLGYIAWSFCRDEGRPAISDIGYQNGEPEILPGERRRPGFM